MLLNMKIKIIEKNTEDVGDLNFENEINEFIKDKKVKDIKYNIQIIYSCFFETFEKNEFEIEGHELKSVMILYEE